MQKYTSRVVIQAETYSDSQNDADEFLLGMLCSPPAGIMETGYSVKLLEENDD